MSSYNPLSEEEIQRINEQRRKNRMMMAAIGFVLLVLLAIFSPGYKWIFVLATILVAMGFFFLRIQLEKQARLRARASQEEEQEDEEN